MYCLDNRAKQVLLEIARKALRVAAERREPLEELSQDVALGESTGAFVTLRKRGRLRGCIGQIGTGRPLAEVVAHSAKSAAVEDPRFHPVEPDEVLGIEIEISVLSALEDIAPEKIEAGRHGLMVSRGWQHGLLLPQVAAEFRWTAARFLEEACVKAGLDRDAWREPGTRIQAFTAEVFSEAEFPAQDRPNLELRPKPSYSSST